MEMGPDLINFIKKQNNHWAKKALDGDWGWPYITISEKFLERNFENNEREV